MGSAKARYNGVKAFSKTGQIENRKAIDALSALADRTLARKVEQGCQIRTVWTGGEGS